MPRATMSLTSSQDSDCQPAGELTVRQNRGSPAEGQHEAITCCRQGGNARGKNKTGYFFAETAKGRIRTPFITRMRRVPRGNTEPSRSIGWVPAPAPFPTSERGRDSQRDRLNQPRGFEPGASSFRGGRLPL